MNWLIAPLDGSFEHAQFDCGDEALNRFIRQYARQQQDKHLGQTRVAVAEESRRVIGFYTLSAGSIGFQSLDERLRRQLPKYPIPAARLGRLAVDKSAQGQGLGHKLLAHALTAVAEISGNIGIAAIIVDAKDEKAAAFYRRFGFMPCQDQPLALYLMTETLRGALGKSSDTNSTLSDFMPSAGSTSLPPTGEGQDGGEQITQQIDLYRPNPNPPPLGEGAKPVAT